MYVYFYMYACNCKQKKCENTIHIHTFLYIGKGIHGLRHTWDIQYIHDHTKGKVYTGYGWGTWGKVDLQDYYTYIFIQCT